MGPAKNIVEGEVYFYHDWKFCPCCYQNSHILIILILRKLPFHRFCREFLKVSTIANANY